MDGEQHHMLSEAAVSVSECNSDSNIRTNTSNSSETAPGYLHWSRTPSISISDPHVYNPQQTSILRDRLNHVTLSPSAARIHTGLHEATTSTTEDLPSIDMNHHSSQSPRKRLWSSRRDSSNSSALPAPIIRTSSSITSKTRSRESFIASLVQRVVTKEDQSVALIYRIDRDAGCFCQPLFGSSTLGTISRFPLSNYLSTLPNSTAKEREASKRKSKSTPKSKRNSTVKCHPTHPDESKSGKLQTFNFFCTKYVPVEIFEQIISSLSRHDVKQMRLVNHDWERKVARYLFKSVVVPFNTKIYGMLEKSIPRTHRPCAMSADIPNASLQNQAAFSFTYDNTSSDLELEQGLDMFGGFGPHMRHFGISFEVDEDILSKPPPKSSQNGHDSYWGGYLWPSKEYQRFADRAGLEVTADETATMIKAFAKLEDVTHLAVAVDSGLGYMRGPDVSLRTRIIAEKPEVFGSSRFVVDPKIQSKRRLWQYLERVYRRVGYQQDFKCAEICRIGTFDDEPAVLQLMGDNSTEIWYQIEPELVINSIEEPLSDEGADARDRAPNQKSGVPHHGILLVRASPKCEDKKFKYVRSVIPTDISKSQQEWLLETAWAQDAFLSSYMLSITDNARNFQKVERLDLSRISSRHLHKLCRQDFWNSLPNLSTLAIMVVADWRDVEKDETGAANTPNISPSDAVECFRTLIRELVAPRKSITTLSIGWAEGGEHAEGIRNRNKNLLPAPMTSLQWLTRVNDRNHGDMLILPFVQHLKLTNCWVTPNALTTFLTHHSQLNMEIVTLDSVSLTTHPRFARPGAQAGLGDFANMLAANPGAIPQLPVGWLQQIAQMHPNQLAMLAHHSGLPFPNAGVLGNPNQHVHPLHLGTNAQPGGSQFPQGGGVANPPAIGQQAVIVPAAAIAYIHAFPNAAALQLALMHHLINIAQGPVQGANLPPLTNQQQLHGQQPAAASPQAQPVQRSREGSWPQLLSAINSAIFAQNTSDNHSTDSERNDQPIIESAVISDFSKTLKVYLCSVGYARLRPRDFDQSVLERAEATQQRYDQWHNPTDPTGDIKSYFTTRSEALEELVMTTSDEWLGSIVSIMPTGEMEALVNNWGAAAVREGWPAVQGDEDKQMWGRWGKKTAEAAWFDGTRKGGSGRFSGTIVLGVSIETEDHDE